MKFEGAGAGAGLVAGSVLVLEVLINKRKAMTSKEYASTLK
jgi:hypothetical protein